ncbi:MAG: asparagine synthetase B [Chloroflexi bacterium]|nr:asparagine synthetase B [Chloroflexota bacterium]
MSGLAALFHRDWRPVGRQAIWDMLAAASYRGPEGLRTSILGPIALGHAKMAVTPEDEAERQPLASRRTGCVLVADARLDNRDDLLLRLPDRPQLTAGDGELILRAYETWGLDAPAHLLGDFAFVIWDPRQQCLVCARDTAGQRTLFYRADAHTFAAASEIHQLLQDTTVPIEPNDERVRESLVPLNALRNEKDDAATYYAGIHAVPAGHVLVVDRVDLRVRRYWEFEPPGELRYRRDEDYAEHFRDVFFEVVRARLRSARPLGALLSGGLDSSSVVCTAHELFRRSDAHHPGFASFSYVFDGLECDERDLIADIQAKYGFDARFVTCGSFAGRLDLEPPGFQHSPNMGVREARDTIFGAISAAGVRAVLTGDVGDSCIYGSYLVLDSLLRQGRLGAFWNYLRAYRRASGASLRKTLRLYCLTPLLPLALQRRLLAADAERQVRRHWRRLLPDWMPEPLREDLARRHLARVVTDERARRFASPARETEYRLLYPPETLPNLAPWPVEVWRPFVDRRLHAFLFAIPPEQKFAPHPTAERFYAGSKRLIRAAMRGILPESIRTRTAKTVFNVAFHTELREHWPVYEAAFGPAARSEVAARGYVDQRRFWERLQTVRDGQKGPDFTYIVHIIELETWLRSLRLPRPQLVTVPPPWGRQPLPAAQRVDAVAVGGGE